MKTGRRSTGGGRGDRPRSRQGGARRRAARRPAPGAERTGNAETVVGDLAWRGIMGLSDALARYTRLEIEVPDRLPDPPALLVANHGFGGIVDPNVLVIGSLARRLAAREDAGLTILAHQMGWTFGLGPLLEPAGARVASRESALEGIESGHYVLVFPGGDLDAVKSFRNRNEVVFGGRTGFAKIALEAGVPIVPIVASGAGETAIVLSDGRRLASLLRLPRLLRQKTIPISIAIPYGLNVGVAGFLPYFPLPAKMRVAVLDPVRAGQGETAESLAARVHGAMSAKLHEMTAGRVPFLGMRWEELLGGRAAPPPGRPNRPGRTKRARRGRSGRTAPRGGDRS